MTGRKKCRVLIDGVECEREEILEKKKDIVGRKPGSGAPISHHECPEGHKFHIVSAGGACEPCDC